MDYKGEDLILVTGAPGSRWSATCRTISFNKEINNSDEKEEWKYDHVTKNIETGKKKEHGWHRGAYWGPYHQQGHFFDQLDKLSKDEIITEFKKPFAVWDSGKKIIKSHWFSYHLPLLKEMFPEAKMLAVYMPDDFCFDWWHKVGGWNITYPYYKWYSNDDKMMKQIQTENQYIKNFFNLKQYTLYQLLEELNLPIEIPSDEDLDKQDDKLRSLTEEKNYNYIELLELVISRNKMGLL